MPSRVCLVRAASSRKLPRAIVPYGRDPWFVDGHTCRDTMPSIAKQSTPSSLSRAGARSTSSLNHNKTHAPRLSISSSERQTRMCQRHARLCHEAHLHSPP